MNSEISYNLSFYDIQLPIQIIKNFNKYNLRKILGLCEIDKITKNIEEKKVLSKIYSQTQEYFGQKLKNFMKFYEEYRATASRTTSCLLLAAFSKMSTERLSWKRLAKDAAFAASATLSPFTKASKCGRASWPSLEAVYLMCLMHYQWYTLFSTVMGRFTLYSTVNNNNNNNIMTLMDEISSWTYLGKMKDQTSS